MSTEATLWAITQDYPKDIIYHESDISPYCTGSFYLGSDYFRDFPTYLRVCIQSTFPHLLSARADSVPETPQPITVGGIAEFERRAQQWPTCEWYKMEYGESYFQHEGYTYKNLPSGAQGLDEGLLQDTVDWLTKYTDHSLLMEVDG